MIVLNNVTKRYRRGVTALRSVSIDLDGKSVAVLGDKGAGKTALAKILCGITAPNAGSATLNGVSLTSRTVADAVGYMPETCPLAPSLTLAENLTSLAKIRGLDMSAVDTALEEVDMLNELADVPLSILGLFASKRASLAYALLGSPKYLVLDQPISGLSEEEEEEMMALLEGLKETYSLIYLSDTVDDARRLCDRVLLLSNGKVVAYDAFDAVISPSFEIVDYKLRTRGNSDALKTALSQNENIIKYQVSVTASGTAIIELTLKYFEGVEDSLKVALSEAGQKVLEIKKVNSPVEKVLSRLYDIQDAKEEARRLSREEKAEPIKVTDALAALSVATAVSDDSEEEEEWENGTEAEKETTPVENGKKSVFNSELFDRISSRDDSKDGESTEDSEDNGGSTLF